MSRTAPTRSCWRPKSINDVTMPLNIGTGIGTSIRELVETINAVTGFEGKIAWNADKPDGAMMKVLDVGRMKQALDGWAPPTEPEGRPGQDHRLVPGQQGPGGRQMVNRRHWYRHNMPPGTRDQPHLEPARPRRRPARHRSGRRRRVPAPRGLGSARSRESGGQAGPLHQPVLLARPRLDGPAPDRPGRIAGRPRVRVPRAGARRAATSRASPGRRRTKSTRACTSTACPRPRWAAAAPGPG